MSNAHLIWTVSHQLPVCNGYPFEIVNKPMCSLDMSLKGRMNLSHASSFNDRVIQAVKGFRCQDFMQLQLDSIQEWISLFFA